MACAITSGRKVPCKSAFGGIKTVYFCNYGDATITLDATTDEVETIAMTGDTKFYQYDVKGNSSLETTITSSRDNGTTFYTQTLNLILPYLDNLTKNEVQLLAAGRPQMIVEDYYGNRFFCGYENGMDLTGGTIVTGAAAGDLSGFTLTMEGMEEFAPFFLESALTITVGTQIDPTSAAVPQP